ncbi:DUF550 domain-containing protein [Salmonella enterica]|uniref:DUF550 domain-containing protein n=1 Tax=Salmonella enterica TaxID=28901 RepID=UPI0020CB5C8D|nr:DUF550 domain-containing protein [Salmonella enterica]
MYRVIPLYTDSPVPERERIRREHAEWSDKTFGDVGPVGPLKHLSKEALEAAADPSDPLEWADMQFLLWDAQRRAGVTDEQITMAMVEKLAINKARQWPEPKDGEPRLHIKEQLIATAKAEIASRRYMIESGEWGAEAVEFYKRKLAPSEIALASLTDEPVKRVNADQMHRVCLEANRHLDKYGAMAKEVNKLLGRTAPPVQVVPEEMPAGLAGQIVSLLAHNIGDKFLAQKIWNACRAAMLQGKFRDLSQPVDPQIAKYEQIMLQAGWVMVPVEPTDEMIAAAMNCDDVVFDSTDPTAFCVQYREIYCVMVDTAPKPEEITDELA